MSPNQALQQARVERYWTKQDVAGHLGIPWQTVALWEQGTAIPDHAFCQRLCALFGKTAQELGLSAHPKASGLSSPHWFVPLPLNRFFTGREADLRALHEQFHLPSDKAQTRVQVVCGVGGIGKTQLALEYANRFCDDYEAVFWLRAQTRETLLADLMGLVDALDLPEKPEREQMQILSAIKHWLKGQANWLLILDHVEDFALVRELVHPRCGGHVILTTQRQKTSTFGYCLHLQPWSPEDGALFLLHRASLLPQHATLEAAAEELRRQATDVCQELGGLPLALDQAGAYLEETGSTLSSYQQRLQEDPLLLLSRRGSEHFAHPDPVTTTILLSVERVEHQCPAAAELLRLCAFLDCDAIPEGLITGQSAEILFSVPSSGSRKAIDSCYPPTGEVYTPNPHESSGNALGPVLYTSATDPLSMDAIYTTIHETSLMELNVQTRLLTIHRLVQTVIVAHMDKETQQLWARRALLAVNQAFPVSTGRSGLVQAGRNKTLPLSVPMALSWPDRLLSHALLTLTGVDRFLPEEQQSTLASEMSDLMCKVGNYLIMRGCYQEAQPLLERCLSLREQRLGLTHPALVEPLARLGFLSRVQGRYAYAQALLERVLALYEQESLPNLMTLSHTSTCKERDKERDGASLSSTRSEQMSILVYTDLIAVLSNLAMVSLDRGHYSQAEVLMKRVISIQEQLPGFDGIGLTLTDLAIVYRRQRRYQEAKALLLHALRLCERNLGPEHPDLLVVLNDLANFYMEQGKYAEAKVFYLRALHLSERAQGLEAPQVAMALLNLADLSRKQERFEDAESQYMRAFELWEQTAGQGHLLTAYALHGLALLRVAQDWQQEAESFFLRTIQIREQACDEEHADLAEALHDLALLYCKQGKDDAAEPLLERALRIREQILGPRHPAVAASLHHLGLLYARQGKKDKARSSYQRSLALREQVLGRRHPETQKTRNCLKALGQGQAATPLLSAMKKEPGNKLSHLPKGLANLGCSLPTLWDDY